MLNFAPHSTHVSPRLTQIAHPSLPKKYEGVISGLAVELDATRKLALAEVPRLTMTELYNWRDKLRSGAKLSPAGVDRASTARAAKPAAKRP